MESGKTWEVVREEASGILEEMAHNLQLGFIRLLGFIFTKVFKRLFRSIHVNQEGLNRVSMDSESTTVIYTWASAALWFIYHNNLP